MRSPQGLDSLPHTHTPTLGDIIDENHGEFAGQIVANNYRWSSSGIELHG